MWGIRTKAKEERKTLLEKALEVPDARKLGPVKIATLEEVQLAVAWSLGEISLHQAKKASGTYDSPTALYTLLARGLSKYIQDNKF